MNIIYEQYFAVAVFAVSFIVSRIIDDRSLKLLSIDEKARLATAFSKYRLFSSALLIVVVILLLASEKIVSNSSAQISFAYPLVVVPLSLLLTFFSYRKLAVLNLPKAYLKMYLLSSLIQYVGLVFIFIPNMAKSYNEMH